MSLKRYKNYKDVRKYVKGSKKVKVNNIKFKKIISNKCTHGLICVGKIHNKICVIKVIILKSGIPHNEKKYYNDIDHLSKSKLKYLKKKNFRKLKPISYNELIKEAYELYYLNSIGVGLKFYGYNVLNNKKYYGFLVMGKAETTIKDILLKRRLASSEKKKIRKFINKMHDRGVTHGDLKPSNIGVFLNEHGKIKRCVAFDCKKAKHNIYYKLHDFKKFIKDDIRHYKRHASKNKKERHK